MYVARARDRRILAVKTSGLNAHSLLGRSVDFKFYLIFDNSGGLWVGIQSADDLLSPTSKVRILHSAEEYDYVLSIRNHFPVPEHNHNQAKNIHNERLGICNWIMNMHD